MSDPAATAESAPAEGRRRTGRFARVFAKYHDALGTARGTLFWACLVRQKRTLRWLFATLFVSVIGVFEVANLTRGMVDNAIVDQTAPLWPYVTHILFWATWSLVFGFVNLQLGERLSYQIEFDLRIWLYTHVQSGELRQLDQVATGQLVTRSITDLQFISQFLAVFPALIGAAPLLLAIGLLVIILNPFIGLIAILALPINTWLVRKISRRLRALSWAELNERAEVTRVIDEPVRGIRVVKAFGREGEEIRKVEAATSRAYAYSMTRTRLLARYDAIIRAAPIAIDALLLGVGAWQLSIGALSLGTFLLAFQLGTGLSAFASAFGELSNVWQYLRGAQDRLAEMLALAARPVTDGRMVPPRSVGLALDHVGVTMGDRRFLGELTLDIAPGELVVVHGAPGSGKSTLAGIASGLVVPDAGEARLESLALAEIDPLELRRAIRVVSEEPLLLAATLRDNLLLGAWGEVTDDELVRALHTAGADDLLEQIDGGLDGLVGDRGLTVSGGQRQRISLARALVAHPRVLVLDDALSAVNPSLETEIMLRVREHLPETSILSITRRAGLQDLADRSYDLPRPRVVDEAGDRLADPTAGFAHVDESTTITEAGPSGDVIADVMSVQEAEIASDPAGAEDSPAPALGRTDTTALHRIDTDLAALVDSLAVSDDRVDVGPDLVYQDQRGTVRSNVRPFRRLLVGSLVVVVLLAIVQIMPDLVFGEVSDLVGDANHTDLTAALAASAGLLVAAILVWYLSYRFRIGAQQLTQSIILVLRRRVFARLTHLGINYYDAELPGDVATRVVADLDNIIRFAQGPGFILVSNIAVAVVAMIAILVLAPSTWVIVLVMVVILFALTWAQLPFAMRAFGWAREELQVVTRKFQEDFTARAEIRTLGAHEIQTKKYVEACWERRRARWWATTVQNLYSAAITFVATATSAFLLWKTGQGVLAQSLSVGVALAVQLLANTATLPLRTLGPLYNQGLDVRVSWQRLQQPFEVAILPVEAPDPEPCADLRHSTIQFVDVSFAYPSTTRRVLRDASFTMQAGAVTALVGYTGAGKSSVAKLLMRTYDPDRGRITVDGTDIRDLEVASYRGRLGIVPQDPFVFRGTVASNVRYGKPDATDDEVEAAIRAVGGDDILSVLPGRFEHAVAEEGRNLTAAQRQLIALARAWLARPDLLVLDEATSLLDHSVEHHVIAAIHELGCTTLMITHREAVADLADHIVVLDAGQVVDEGPAALVAGSDGPYERLWRMVDDGSAAEPITP